MRTMALDVSVPRLLLTRMLGRVTQSVLSNPFLLAGAVALGYAGAKALRGLRRLDQEHDLLFQDKVAIVTGGASGIGRALCQELSHRGATVIVADIDAAGAGQVASAIASAGDQAHSARLDVSQVEQVQRLIDQTVSEYGRLDYMFNNAGIAVVGAVHDMDLAQWKRLLDVNLWGAIYGTTAAYQQMSKQGFGHIVNTASAAGLFPSPIVAAYATTKHAVVGFSTSLRSEAAVLGVKVSVVCPGIVQTGMFHSTPLIGFKEFDREEAVEKLTSLFRIMDATDAARVILCGVARNEAIITVTAYTRVMWWLYRLNPALLDPILRKAAQGFWVLRGVPEGAAILELGAGQPGFEGLASNKTLW